ncbi:hypothetical protein [Micromonospora sp. NPDC049891]|uniref:hypothetical protein n=1 Tax=Micromonospora sp. NPDC049891 TaxID=3155655 RepID=UPI0033D4876A
MATATEVDEFSYLVPGWLWKQQPATVLRRARQAAKRKRKTADGEPQVHVVLVWPQDAKTTA